MITIDSLPISPFLTSDIPDSINISSQDDQITVTVYHGTTQIFTTDLYPYNGKAQLVNLREIIEDYMRENGLQCGTFSVNVSSDADQATTGDFIAVYCNYKIPNRSADFFEIHFLTTRTSFLIHPDETQALSWYQNETPDDSNVYTEFLVKTDEGMKTYKKMDRPDNGTFETDYIVPQKLFETLQKEQTDAVGTLLSMTVHRGKRTITFYITNETPDHSFLFRNCFNCIEYAHLYAATTLKADVDRSEATCNGTTQFYDQQTTHTHEVNVTTLSLEHALWLTQLMESHEVKDNATAKPILITDITAEISDETNAVNKLKFSWRYADNSLTLK